MDAAAAWLLSAARRSQMYGCAQINNLLGAIGRRQKRDKIILATVIGACVSLLLPVKLRYAAKKADAAPAGGAGTCARARPQLAFRSASYDLSSCSHRVVLHAARANGIDSAHRAQRSMAVVHLRMLQLS